MAHLPAVAARQVCSSDHLADEVPGELARAGQRPAGADHELGQSLGHVLADHDAGARPAGRDQRGRIAVGAAFACRLEQRGRGRLVRDGQADPVVVRLDPAAGLGGGRLDGPAARARLGRGQETGQPPVTEPPDAAQRTGGAAAEPDVQRPGRPRADAGAIDGEELALERDALLAEQQPDQRQGFVEHRGPAAGRHRERGQFRGPGRFEAEDRQHPPGGQASQGGELLGHQDRVAPGQHRHPRAHLQPGRPGQRVGHADERVNQGPVDHLRQPQGIGPGGLQCVHRRAELGGATRRAERDADPDLHGVIRHAAIRSHDTESRARAANRWVGQGGLQP